jgi:hypothetical protein
LGTLKRITSPSIETYPLYRNRQKEKEKETHTRLMTSVGRENGEEEKDKNMKKYDLHIENGMKFELDCMALFSLEQNKYNVFILSECSY